MKTLTFEQYKTANNYIFNLPLYFSFEFEEIQEFLNRKGYNLVLHTAVYENLRHIRSIPGTGEVETIGYLNTERTHVIAIKPGITLPLRFTKETLEEFDFDLVFKREVRKNLLA